MDENRKLKKSEILIVAAVLLVAVAVLVLRSMNAVQGEVANLYITDPQQVIEVPLDKDGEFVYEAALTVTLEVKDGAVRFVNSLCPDHLCEGFGFIKNAGETATCLPAGAHLEIPQN